MMDVVHPISDPIQHIRRRAAERFQQATDWVSFYREILGIKGLVDQMFPHFRERSEFERTEAYAEIQQMLARLRAEGGPSREPDEPTRVITVRLPQSLHEALRYEAHNYRTSMNKLCISKLLQVIADDLVPSDFERRDTERPPRTAPPESATGEAPQANDDWTSRSLPSRPLPGLAAEGLMDYSLPSSDTLGGGRPF